jgi:hypothetical protein
MILKGFFMFSKEILLSLFLTNAKSMILYISYYLYITYINSMKLKYKVGTKTEGLREA